MGLLANYKKSEVVIAKEKFQSNFDYSEFNLDDREQLIDLEKRAIHTGKLLRDNLKELGEVFVEAQDIFANNKNGMFGKWYENLGYKKDFVYLCIDRINLAIQYNTKDVYKLPDRMIKDIKKISSQSENEEVIAEILTSENPKEKLKEIKETLFKPKEVKEVEIIENSRKLEVSSRLKSILSIIERNEFSNEKLQKLEILITRLEDEIY
nr:hypothetical protein [uncultured Cetobacterium sp.]